MEFREREIDFREADRRYAEIKRQLDAGTMSTEDFDAQLRRLMVQDDEGRWWAKSRKTGEWNYHDGNAWIRGIPPGYQPPPTLPADSIPDHQSPLKQDEQPPLAQSTTPPSSAATQVQSSGKQRRVVLQGIIIAAGLLLAAGILLWSEGGALFQEAQELVSGYSLFEHESGALSVEIPSEWDERATVDSEGEKGRTSWSEFLGDGESPGPSMTAVNDLDSWRNGTPGHQGIYMVASKKLAQNHTDEELVASGPNDYSSSCEAGATQDFNRPPYAGKILEWENCGGNSEHVAVALSIAPEGRECVIVAQIGGLPRVDEETVQHILDTFETDCSRID